MVLLPTDTLYGLGADVFSLPALKRVFSIKGRPPDLALPVLVGSWEQVELVARDVPESGRLLAGRFWRYGPGRPRALWGLLRWLGWAWRSSTA